MRNSLTLQVELCQKMVNTKFVDDLCEENTYSEDDIQSIFEELEKVNYI